MDGDTQGRRDTRLPLLKRAFGELVVVGGLSLAMIFWIVPSQTTSGGELGLSPQLLPMVCSAAIGLLTLFRFIAVLVSPPPIDAAGASPDDTAPIRYALGVIAATGCGILAISYFGWAIGSGILSVLVLLALGERKLPLLFVLPVLVAVMLYLIQLTGI